MQLETNHACFVYSSFASHAIEIPQVIPGDTSSITTTIAQSSSDHHLATNPYGDEKRHGRNPPASAIYTQPMHVGAKTVMCAI